MSQKEHALGIWAQNPGGITTIKQRLIRPLPPPLWGPSYPKLFSSPCPNKGEGWGGDRYPVSGVRPSGRLRVRSGGGRSRRPAAPLRPSASPAAGRPNPRPAHRLRRDKWACSLRTWCIQLGTVSPELNHRLHTLGHALPGGSTSHTL